MNTTAYIAEGESTSPKFCEAFAAGCDGNVSTDGEISSGAIALFGSPKLWPIFKAASASGRTFYYGDHGYFQRGHYYRITKNALQFEPGPGECDLTRLCRLDIKLEPWRKDGGHILICPPDAIFSELMGFDAGDWLRYATQEVRAHTDRPITIRDRRSRVPLENDFCDCWALVTYHSNVAVEAVCAGIPVFVTGFGAAKPMGLSDLAEIEYPAMPDWRAEWAASLSNNQWTLDEITAGMAWRELNK